MIDPTVAVAVALSGWRLVTSERRSARLDGEREQHDLLRLAGTLPAGAEVGEIRPDGSAWWIRIPTGARS
jgi:hypothetical protein